VHITDSSPVAEHCSTFSLGDSSDADLKQSCSHIHDQKCDQCTSLASALSDIEKLLREISFNPQSFITITQSCSQGSAAVVVILQHVIHMLKTEHPEIEKVGKGAADRTGATAKTRIRMYVNEGNDVTNAHQMKDALLSHGGVKGVRV
ncbi:unnamed protein product, partial [Pocillopora meandrina]